MPSLKEYKAKLASLRNTRKMTKTMKMVAASKLRRTMDAQRKARVYAAGLHDMLGVAWPGRSTPAHPLLQPRPGQKGAGAGGHVRQGHVRRLQQQPDSHGPRWMEHHRGERPALDLSFCGPARLLAVLPQPRNGMPQDYYDGRDAIAPRTLDAVRMADDLSRFISGGTTRSTSPSTTSSARSPEPR
jgi:hypothetical protein